MDRAALDEWLRLAEAQLDAARRIDGPALAAHTEARRVLQARIDPAAVRRWGPDERAEAARVARRVRTLDLRIRACGQSVLAAIAAVMPDTGPATYGRRGHLRGS